MAQFSSMIGAKVKLSVNTRISTLSRQRKINKENEEWIKEILQKHLEDRD